MASSSTIDPQALETAELMTVASIMKSSLRTCSPFSSVTEASLIFRDEDCGFVPVVDEGKPIGVVTDRDVAVSLSTYPDLGSRPVSEIMTTEVVTISPNATLGAAADLMASKQIRRLPVIDESGLLIGIVAWADLAPMVPNSTTGSMVSQVVEHA